MGSSGRYNAMDVFGGSKGYVGMGTDGTNRLSDFWEYDPTTDARTQKANFIGVPVQGAAAMVVGSNAYIVGGSEVTTSSLTGKTGSLIHKPMYGRLKPVPGWCPPQHDGPLALVQWLCGYGLQFYLLFDFMPITLPPIPGPVYTLRRSWS